MDGANPKMTCGGCGKSVAWKPEYAGKRLRCKCGFVMVGPPAPPAHVAPRPAAPAGATSGDGTMSAARGAAKPAMAPPPPAAPAGHDVDDFERLVAQAEEYAIADEPAQPAQQAQQQQPRRRRSASAAQIPLPGAAVPAGAAGAAVATAPSPFLAYARAVPKKPDESATTDQLRDFIVPLALIVGGILTYFFDAHLRGLHNPLLMSVFVLITCVINLILVFTALMIGVKLIDLGLGNFGPAMLKIVAVALLPGAVGDIVRFYSFGLLSFGLSLLMYYVLLYYLFDMDGQEMSIVTGIIWLVQTWVGFLILALLFSTMGIGPRGASGGGGTSSGSSSTAPMFMPGGDRPEPAPPDPDETALSEIHAGTAVEFRKWIEPDLHGVMRGSRGLVLQQAERYYAAGAKTVWAMQIEKRDQMEICHEMVIELPTDPAARKAFFKNLYGDFDEPGDRDPEHGKRFIHESLD